MNSEKALSIATADGPILVEDPALKNMIAYVEQGKYNSAIQWIQNKSKEEEQVVSRSETFEAYPADGAYAFTQVLRQVYGWIEQRPIQTFFGPKPPVMLVVEKADGKVEVPWGEVKVPNIDGSMHLHAVNEHGVWKFAISAEVKKKHIHLVKELCEKTRKYVAGHSIYRGQALRLEWLETAPTAFTKGESGFDTPRFMAPTGLMKSDLVLPQVTYEEINATVFSLIENSERARRMGVPTKRLVLAAGPYGTGKTLTATITAELCRKHGRTFLYLRDVRHLADAIYFAQQYAPACVFAEDIDIVTDAEDVDLISNTIDGVDTKQLDVLFILTTNHVNAIPKKFLRSGRSDMIIKYTPPDYEAAAKLIMKYGSDTINHDLFTFEDALEIGADLASVEMIPASIREVVERAKLFALAYDRTMITRVDLERAAHGVKEQCELQAEKRPEVLPPHMEVQGVMIRMKDKTVAAQVVSRK